MTRSSACGTSWASIDRAGDVVLETEEKGAREIRTLVNGSRAILVLPPSLAVLADRLAGRRREGAPELARRLEIARRQLQTRVEFDYCVVNDELGRCVEDLRAIIQGERAARGYAA